MANLSEVDSMQRTMKNQTGRWRVFLSTGLDANALRHELFISQRFRSGQVRERSAPRSTAAFL